MYVSGTTDGRRARWHCSCAQSLEDLIIHIGTCYTDSSCLPENCIAIRTPQDNKLERTLVSGRLLSAGLEDRGTLEGRDRAQHRDPYRLVRLVGRCQMPRSPRDLGVGANDHGNAWHVAFQPESGIATRHKDSPGSPQISSVPRAPGRDWLAQRLSLIVTQLRQTRIAGHDFRLAAIPAVGPVQVRAGRSDSNRAASSRTSLRDASNSTSSSGSFIIL